MKRGKEVELPLHNNYSVVSGTVDNKQPKSIYIQISSWGLPKTEHPDYEKVLRRKTSRIKRKLNEIIGNDFHKNRCIVDFNMASSGISQGKRSYMCVEMTLFKKEPYLPVNSEKLKPILTNISEEIINNVFEKDEDFDFFKRKK